MIQRHCHYRWNLKTMTTRMMPRLSFDVPMKWPMGWIGDGWRMSAAVITFPMTKTTTMMEMQTRTRRRRCRHWQNAASGNRRAATAVGTETEMTMMTTWMMMTWMRTRTMGCDAAAARGQARRDPAWPAAAESANFRKIKYDTDLMRNVKQSGRQIKV